MKCLLVDDEPGIREGLAALLRRKGHDVRTAADCARAREALASDRFDVVVTDWHLPDGLASTFLAAATCPVLAVSGHPEEVERQAPIVDVLTKPVTPTRLQEALAAAGPRPAAVPTADLAALPADVRAVVEQALSRVPADATVELRDDGTFVTLVAELADGRPFAFGLPDGDLRSTLQQGRRRLELRLCRDGRPDAALPVVGALSPWPAVGPFAVDFHGTAVDPGTFVPLLDRVRAAHAAGRELHLLNLPAALRTQVCQGTSHDMPMRAPVGPRLRPELADLWSQS